MLEVSHNDTSSCHEIRITGKAPEKAATYAISMPQMCAQILRRGQQETIRLDEWSALGTEWNFNARRRGHHRSGASIRAAYLGASRPSGCHNSIGLPSGSRRRAKRPFG